MGAGGLLDPCFSWQSGEYDPQGRRPRRNGVGPFGSTGNLAITVVARDMAGNSTSPKGPTTVFVHCIG